MIGGTRGEGRAEVDRKVLPRNVMGEKSIRSPIILQIFVFLVSKQVVIRAIDCDRIEITTFDTEDSFKRNRILDLRTNVITRDEHAPDVHTGIHTARERDLVSQAPIPSNSGRHGAASTRNKFDLDHLACNLNCKCSKTSRLYAASRLP